MAQGKSIRIGELSRRTGCNIETIRYYERIGLLPEPARRGTYRHYDASSVSLVSFIRRARVLGFTLHEIRALLNLAVVGPQGCNKVRDIAFAHLTDIRERIADLMAVEKTLTAAIMRCMARPQPVCPVIEVLSDAAAGP